MTKSVVLIVLGVSLLELPAAPLPAAQSDAVVSGRVEKAVPVDIITEKPFGFNGRYAYFRTSYVF